MSDNARLIESLHQSYQQSFAQKKATLSELSENLALQTGPSELEAMQNFLHKLAGSAGMYGYDEISRVAQQAMDSSALGEYEQQATHVEQLLVLLEAS